MYLMFYKTYYCTKIIILTFQQLIQSGILYTYAVVCCIYINIIQRQILVHLYIYCSCCLLVTPLIHCLLLLFLNSTNSCIKHQNPEMPHHSQQLNSAFLLLGADQIVPRVSFPFPFFPYRKLLPAGAKNDPVRAVKGIKGRSDSR